MPSDWELERLDRHLIAATLLPTGNPWLDDAWAGGLNRNNVVLIAARTGVGKTFFGVQLAHHATKKCRKVLYFALEAEKYEIERRQLYYAVCRILYEKHPQITVPSYRQWLHCGYNASWDALETEARKILDLETDGLQTVYRTEVYTPLQFQQDIIDLAAVPDEQKPHLIILDHLHHFFLDGDETTALKQCIHSIKRIQGDLEIPIVILAQLRKNEVGQKNKRTLPSLEDIRGTAALTDVATDVLLISPVPRDQRETLPSSFHRPMYFHLSKSRTASEAKDFAAIVPFDAKLGGYGQHYVLCKANHFEDPEPCEQIDIPDWATNAIRPKPLPVHKKDTKTTWWEDE